MANFRKCFPRKYLRTADVTEPFEAKIKHVTFEEMPDGKMKPVAYVTGREPGFVLNITNCEALAQLTGSDETEKWIGAHVTIFTEQTRFGGKATQGLRLRGAWPPKQAEPDEPDLDFGEPDFEPEFDYRRTKRKAG